MIWELRRYKHMPFAMMKDFSKTARDAKSQEEYEGFVNREIERGKVVIRRVLLDLVKELNGIIVAEKSE